MKSPLLLLALSVLAAPLVASEADCECSHFPWQPDPPCGAICDARRLYNEGVIAYNAGDVATAIAKFEEAAVRDPKLVAAPLTLSGLYLDQKKHAEAAAAAEKVLALEPDNALALRNRYDVYNEGGQKEKAEAALQELVAKVKDRETAVRVFNLGATAARADDMETAVARIRQAIEIDPTLEQGYLSLAGIYLSKKQYKEAAKIAERHLAVNPNSLVAMNVRVEAYRQLGDKTKASEAQAQMEAALANQTKVAEALGTTAPTGTTQPPPTGTTQPPTGTVQPPTGTNVGGGTTTGTNTTGTTTQTQVAAPMLMDGLVNLNVSQVLANLSVQANLQNIVVDISDVLNNVQVQAVVQALNTNPQASTVADQLTDQMRQRGMLAPNERIVGASGGTLYKLAG